MIGDIEGELEKRDRKAQHIRRIYDEATELQDSITNLWGLDQNHLQRMEDLQEQLISEIHDLAPERAKNLRTMLHILNINHHVCLIQVSSRTQGLVFNEFLHRVREFLEEY